MTNETVVENLLTALPAWQLAVFRFNDAVAARLGIAPSDLQCLFVLDRRGRSSPTELAGIINLSTGAMSRMIERLLRAGMVTRESDTTDRRRVHVEITAGARADLYGLYRPLDDDLRELMRPMDPATLAQLLRLAEDAGALTSRLERQLLDRG